jgi:hypothetical protein
MPTSDSTTKVLLSLAADQLSAPTNQHRLSRLP